MYQDWKPKPWNAASHPAKTSPPTGPGTSDRVVNIAPAPRSVSAPAYDAHDSTAPRTTATTLVRRAIDNHSSGEGREKYAAVGDRRWTILCEQVVPLSRLLRVIPDLRQRLPIHRAQDAAHVLDPAVIVERHGRPHDSGVNVATIRAQRKHAPWHRVDEQRIQSLPRRM